MTPLQEAARRHGVEIARVISETPTSLVALGELRGKAVVLKVLHDASDEHGAAALLNAWREGPVVRLIASSAGAQVLERVLPGDSLESRYDTLADAAGLDVIADVAARLRELHPSSMQLPDARARGASLLDRPRPACVDAPTWQRAQRAYAALAGSQRGVGVIHGDLHHANVLWDAQRGWLAIDPKGVVAELEFEMACALRNPIARAVQWATPDQVQRRVGHVARRLALDGTRLAQWAYAQCVLAAGWDAEDGGDPQAWLRVAQAYASGSI